MAKLSLRSSSPSILRRMSPRLETRPSENHESAGFVIPKTQENRTYHPDCLQKRLLLQPRSAANIRSFRVLHRRLAQGGGYSEIAVRAVRRTISDKGEVNALWSVTGGKRRKYRSRLRQVRNLFRALQARQLPERLPIVPVQRGQPG